MSDQDPGIETLVGLLNHYSPTGMEQECVSFLVSRMKSLGYTKSFVDDIGNAVGIIGEGEKQILLLGHIDTVEGNLPVNVENGMVAGRGAVDAKGALAVFVDAAARIGKIPGWQIVVIGAVDEEGDSRGARHVAEIYIPQVAIIGEPSNWDRITLGYKGVAGVRINIQKEMTHSASIERSACEHAVYIWSKIKNWEQEYNLGIGAQFDRLQLRLDRMESDLDGFEERACIQIGARLPQKLSPQSYYQQLTELISPETYTRLGSEIPAYKADKNTAIVRAFLRSIRAEGGTPRFVTKTGTADLNIVAPAWGCPAVVYGPGDSALDHTPNERVSIDEFNMAKSILTRVLIDVCG